MVGWDFNVVYWLLRNPWESFVFEEIKLLLKHLDWCSQWTASIFCNLTLINLSTISCRLWIELVKEEVEFGENDHYRDVSYSINVSQIKNKAISSPRWLASFRMSSSAVCIRRDPERGDSIHNLIYLMSISYQFKFKGQRRYHSACSRCSTGELFFDLLRINVSITLQWSSEPISKPSVSWSTMQGLSMDVYSRSISAIPACSWAMSMS